MTRKRIGRAAAVILVLGVVWTALAWFAARSLVVNVPLDRADAIVVLSGSACLLERTAEAAELYKAKVASRVVLTNDNLQGGWSSSEQRNPFFYERARDNLMLSGVPQEHIEVIQNPVTSTYDEAQAVRDYAKAKGLQSIIVVTSGYHSRRAFWTLDRVFHNSNIAIGLHSVRTGIETPPPLTWWFHLRGWQMVAGEYLKSLYYRVNVDMPGGETHRLGPKEDLQRAIDRARPGDVIVLDANATYTGPFTLPKKSGKAFVTIQSSRVSELPEGVRVGPAQSALFAKLVSGTGGAPVIKTAPGAHHYRFIGVEISTATEKDKVYDLVQFGDSKQTEADVPHDLVIDRSWIHGWPTQDVQRGISLNGAEITISNSHIAEIHGRGYDTQALCGWNGPGPFRIINNYLEASGENVMFGGALPSITNLVPSNIEIRRNHFFKPLTWKVGHPTYAGIHWSVKNLLEFKNARNVVVDGNVLENCWTDAQIGYAVLFTVRSEDGKAPWATVENVQFTNNTVKNSEQGIQMLGSDHPHRSGRGTGVVISNNLFTGIANRFLTMSGFYNVTFDHNTHFQKGNVMALHGEPSNGFVYTNNITNKSGYGIFGDGVGEGNAAIARYLPGSSWKKNVLIGASAGQYPPNNSYPSSIEKVGFQDHANGNYRLGPRSPFKGTATDGSDPGCQLDRLVTP